MNKSRTCGCKGCRTCLICEKECGITNKTFNLNKDKDTYIYCSECKLAWPGWDFLKEQIHPNHLGNPVRYSGVFVQDNFLTVEEEEFLMGSINNTPWDLSQSGRRKQNYGPKCNFKKKKLQLGSFDGFPKFSKFVQEKFKQVPILRDFQTIEQCSLEYDPKRGASIDPHIDDCWIWGERVVTVNLLADSVLTMTLNDKLSKYNLDCVSHYPAVLHENGEMNELEEPYRRSLCVLYGSARYDWEHQVLRDDIVERRVCLAYREFTPPYLVNDVGQIILSKANKFF
ncbi:hypothetical protein FQA39_LY16398 [Lamprigera yunnana]|nr:hypothetical protein FQA39_LY16398 [Lamprigera yunnana]